MRKAERGEEKLKDTHGDACGATSLITAAALSSCMGPKLRVPLRVEREGTKAVVGVETEISGWDLVAGTRTQRTGRWVLYLLLSKTHRCLTHHAMYCSTACFHSTCQQFSAGVFYGICTLTTPQTPFILYETLSDTPLRGKPPPFVDYGHCLLSTVWCVVNHHSSDVACGRGRVHLRGFDLAPEFRVSCSPSSSRSILQAHVPDGRFYRQIVRGALSEAWELDGIPCRSLCRPTLAGSVSLNPQPRLSS